MDEIENGILIPQRCVRELQGTYSVYVINSAGEIENRMIKLGPKVGGMWMVENGLSAGETVVFEGLNLVRPGAKVQPEKVEIPDFLMKF
jgi:membrane fusion protein (multidrug efflux system)